MGRDEQKRKKKKKKRKRAKDGRFDAGQDDGEMEYTTAMDAGPEEGGMRTHRASLSYRVLYCNALRNQRDAQRRARTDRISIAAPNGMRTMGVRVQTSTGLFSLFFFPPSVFLQTDDR